MISVLKSAGATVANGALQLIYQDTQGILRDVYIANYQIWTGDLSSQVFPVSGTQPIDLVVDRLGVGRFAAIWNSSSATVGGYVVRWFVTPNNGDLQVSFDQDFELVAAAYKGPHYCTIQDLRDQGLLSSVTDVQAQRAIVRASRYVEFYTGREFGYKYAVTEIDGNSARAILLNEPIVAIESLIVTFDSIFNSTTEIIDLSSLKIYNRHLTQRLLRPDDRDSPKIEFVHGDEVWGRVNGGSLFQDRVLWPKGVRNVQLTGMFGYTEPDGSYVGKVPDLVREVTQMLVFQNAVVYANGGYQASGPITKERTRDQEVDYAALRVTGMTGNRSVDVLLAGFRRLPTMGSA